MNTLTIRLNEGEYDLLIELARFLDCGSPETMMRRSVDSWLGESRYKLRALEEARKAVDRGDLIDHDVVEREMDEWITSEEKALATAAE